MTKIIQLSKGQVALVDDWRYEELNQWGWSAQWDEQTKSYYASRRTGTRSAQKKVYMHRHIAGTPKGLDCDHINGHTLDNQEHNLRNATRLQNMINSGPRSTNKLKQKYISPHKGGGYVVKIRRAQKNVFYKWFKHIEDAIAARDAAVQKFDGAFAYRGES